MSFSKETKIFLEELEIRNKCCRKAFESGKNLFSDNSSENGDSFEQNSNKLTVIRSGFKCDMCQNCFIRGIFISHGSVTNPEKGYHLELSFRSEAQRDAVLVYITNFMHHGVLPKKTKRKSMYILYYKDSGAIEDFLAYMGANKAAFEFMNSKILKDIRNDTNRVVNCETANISKSVAASQKQIMVIKELQKAGEFSKLLPELQRTAELRLEFEESSLTELGAKMEPTISKSGISHRLTKIMEHYEKYQNGDK